MPLGMEPDLGPGDFVSDGDPAPAPTKKGHSPPKFSAHVYCGQMARWIKIPLSTEVGLGSRYIVLDRDPAPPKRGTAPQFSAHVYYGQTAVWIKMPLGTEVGLGPGNIVLDGDPAPLPSKKRHSLPIFGPCILWPNGWMDQDATWYRGRPRPRQHCVRWEPSLPFTPKKGHSPHFSAHVYCGQTVAHLSYF